jgi:ABC-type polysaccharide/polyol phosphate transport system ATPase subunit
MSSDIAIKVENLSKCYQIYETPHDRLKQFILPKMKSMLGMQPKQYFRDFWALKNVSFEVKKGETIGIIGRNGSGKSTLLQIICGTLGSTSGVVKTHGRIAALLELGSGFNPEFTGRENIYLNGSIHGLSESQINEKYNEIVEFSEIEKFINQPIKTYSSGMTARLAFSSAIHLSPEILIIDEALSVGDFQFQAKCFEKIKELKNIGTTIIMVSHDLSAITEFSEKVLLISHGKSYFYNETTAAINDFKEQSTRSKKINNEPYQIEKKYPSNKEKYLFYKFSNRFHRSGTGDAEIIDWYLSNSSNEDPINTLIFADNYKVIIKIKCNLDNINPNIGFFFTDVRGNEIAGCTLNHEEYSTGLLKNDDLIIASFKFKVILKPGIYLLNLGCSETINNDLISYDRLYSVVEIVVIGKKEMIGNVHLTPVIKLEKV